MTYKELKNIRKQFINTTLKLSQLRAEAENTAVRVHEVHVSSGISDKVGDISTHIIQTEKELEQIKSKYKAALDSLPDTITGRCIRLKITKNYSWVKLSFMAGDYITPDCIKARCHRLKW